MNCECELCKSYRRRKRVLQQLEDAMKLIVPEPSKQALEDAKELIEDLIDEMADLGFELFHHPDPEEKNETTTPN